MAHALRLSVAQEPEDHIVNNIYNLRDLAPKHAPRRLVAQALRFLVAQAPEDHIGNSNS